VTYEDALALIIDDPDNPFTYERRPRPSWWRPIRSSQEILDAMVGLGEFTITHGGAVHHENLTDQPRQPLPPDLIEELAEIWAGILLADLICRPPNVEPNEAENRSGHSLDTTV
jgi:hypothetical protein